MNAENALIYIHAVFIEEEGGRGNCLTWLVRLNLRVIKRGEETSFIRGVFISSRLSLLRGGKITAIAWDSFPPSLCDVPGAEAAYSPILYYFVHPAPPGPSFFLPPPPKKKKKFAHYHAEKMGRAAAGKARGSKEI